MIDGIAMWVARCLVRSRGAQTDRWSNSSGPLSALHHHCHHHLPSQTQLFRRCDLLDSYPTQKSGYINNVIKPSGFFSTRSYSFPTMNHILRVVWRLYPAAQRSNRTYTTLSVRIARASTLKAGLFAGSLLDVWK